MKLSILEQNVLKNIPAANNKLPVTATLRKPNNRINAPANGPGKKQIMRIYI